MAAPGRRTDSSLEEALFARGYEFEFFQAVRLLVRLFPEHRLPGGTATPSEEVARFEAQLSLAFPPSAVHEIARAGDSPEPARMTVAFLALTGTQGVLPLHYTEWMLARQAAGDHTLAAFLDLFNHRLLSLFYRAWEKHRPPVLYEIAVTRRTQPDLFTRSLFDLIGMGANGLRGRMQVADESLIFYAGLVAQRPCSASALRGMLRDYFSAPVEIDQCIGSWYEIEEPDRSYLDPGMERNQLGVGAFLGDEVWNQQARFRIRLGPVGLERYRDFLPGNSGSIELAELTRFMVGQAMAFELQLYLRAEEVPYCRLQDEGADAPRLGWLGWLKTDEFTSDAGDAVFTWVN